jgi:hypothetical protein
MSKIIRLNPQGKLGAENIQTVFLAVLTIAYDIRELIKAFSYQKLINTALGLVQYGNIIAVAREAVNEFRSLTPAQAKKVRDNVTQEWDVPDDAFEASVEDAIFLVVDTYEWVMNGVGIGKRYADYWNKHIDPEEAMIIPSPKAKAA